MSSILILSVVAVLGAAASQPGGQAGETQLQGTISNQAEQPDRAAYDAIFLHGRARAFQAMALERLCRSSAHRSEIEALTGRLAAAKRRLSVRYGERLFNPPEQPVVEPSRCDDERLSITMLGFRNAIAELEAVAEQRKAE